MMIKNWTLNFLIAGLLFSFSVHSASAQDSRLSEGEKKVDNIIGEALNQVEDGIENVPADEITSRGDRPVAPTIEDPKDVKILDEVILDEKESIGEILETKVIPLLHAEASGIIETLEQMKSPEGVVSFNGKDRTLIIKDVPEQLEAMSAFVKKVDILLETKTFQLKFIGAEGCLDEVENVLSKNVGQVQFDEQENSISVTDTPLKIGEIAELIGKLDYLNKEIHIEAKILQIVLNDEHTNGVDWEAIVSDYRNSPFPGFTFEMDLRENKGLNIGAVTQEDYKILLEALDTVGVVREISNKIINTENEVPHTVSIASSGNLNGTDHSKSALLQEKVLFVITPTINRDNLLTVSIRPELIENGADRLENGPGTDAVIQVESGATIVIGSLFDEVMVESSWKIPLLGDLPLLGFVFRNQGQVPRKTEIITFLTVKTVEKEK